MSRQEIQTGDWVECDICAKDLTHDPASGGFLLVGKGVGPCCAERLERRLRESGEEQHIAARCPEGVSFADWVRRDLRGGRPGVVTILGGEDALDYLRGRPR
jgi:hypothetical protein